MELEEPFELEKVRCPASGKLYQCVRTFFPCVIFRYFAENQPAFLLAPKQLFSRFTLPNDHVAMSTVPRDHMILGIGYSLGDIQLRVSGSRKQGEKTLPAALRELREEFGLVVSREDLQFVCTAAREKTKKKNACIVTHYCLNVDTCGQVKIADEHVAVEEKDDRSRKVSIIVHGSVLNIARLMTVARPLDPDEEISFFALIPSVNALLITAQLDISDDTGG